MTRIIRTTTKPKPKRSAPKKFKPDPKIKGAVLIPLDEALDVVGIKTSPRILPNTVVRQRAEKDDEFRIALVTTMPDGCRVAWDNCGRCHQHVANCLCREGVYHPSSVAWILSKTEEWMGGSEHEPGRYFDPNPRTMRESMSLPPRPEPSARPRKPLSDPMKDDLAPEPRQARSTRQKAAQPVVADTSDIDNLDLAKLGQDAIAVTDKYESMFDDLLNNDKPKRTIKRGKKTS